MLARDRHPPLLHRLQQGRLGPRAGAVNFVCHQQLGKYRPFDKAEVPLAVSPFLQHFRAQDIGGHQVRRELDTFRIHGKNRAQRLHQPCFPKAGHADQQRMAACQQRNQHLVDNIPLAEKDPANRLPRLLQTGGSSVHIGNKAGSGIGCIGLGHRKASQACFNDRHYAGNRMNWRAPPFADRSQSR